MLETPEELTDLQALLVGSLSRSTTPLRSIVTGRTMTAEQLTQVLVGMCTLALSTVTVGLADSWAAHTHLTPAAHAASLVAGHLGGFGVLWILQFVLLDRVLFHRLEGG